MKKTYIQSGMLFDRKYLGRMLATYSYNLGDRSVTKQEILFYIIENIEGNIWRAYLAKYFDEAIEELTSYCTSHAIQLIEQIDKTGYDSRVQLRAEKMLSKIIKRD